jgi:hypothetical protein
MQAEADLQVGQAHGSDLDPDHHHGEDAGQQREMRQV